jgi:hypothetical protein
MTTQDEREHFNNFKRIKFLTTYEERQFQKINPNYEKILYKQYQFDCELMNLSDEKILDLFLNKEELDKIPIHSCYDLLTKYNKGIKSHKHWKSLDRCAPIPYDYGDCNFLCAIYLGTIGRGGCDTMRFESLINELLNHYYELIQKIKRDYEKENPYDIKIITTDIVFDTKCNMCEKTCIKSKMEIHKEYHF